MLHRLCHYSIYNENYVKLKYDDRICYECFMEWQSVILNSVNGQERGPTIHGRLSRPQDRNADGIVPGRQWVLTLESEALMSLHGPRMFSTVSHSLSILAVCSFSPVKDSGMRIAESTRGSTIAICGHKKSVIVADTRGKVNALESRRQTHTMRKNIALIFFSFPFDARCILSCYC